MILKSSSKAVERTISVPGILEVLVDEDIIYGTMNIDDKIVKMDMKGTIIKTVGTEGTKPGQFNSPSGIHLNKDEIYVCDTLNHRIQVFDKELNLVRIFGKQGDGKVCFYKPTDLDFDVDGNIYVADHSNHRIQVLTPDGTHIRNIGSHGAKPGELNKPLSVAIHEGLVYVTDKYNKRVSVFRTTGDFVTAFGEGQLDRPECVAVDDNGFVNVTDNQCN